MLKDEGLRARPFCRGEADPGHYKGNHRDDEYYLVMCMECFARTVGDTLEEAIAAWNRRPAGQTK